jgi:hypothetical protein
METSGESSREDVDMAKAEEPAVAVTAGKKDKVPTERLAMLNFMEKHGPLPKARSDGKIAHGSEKPGNFDELLNCARVYESLKDPKDPGDHIACAIHGILSGRASGLVGTPVTTILRNSLREAMGRGTNQARLIVSTVIREGVAPRGEFRRAMSRAQRHLTAVEDSLRKCISKQFSDALQKAGVETLVINMNAEEDDDDPDEENQHPPPLALATTVRSKETVSDNICLATRATTFFSKCVDLGKLIGELADDPKVDSKTYDKLSQFGKILLETASRASVPPSILGKMKAVGRVVKKEVANAATTVIKWLLGLIEAWIEELGFVFLARSTTNALEGGNATPFSAEELVKSFSTAHGNLSKNLIKFFHSQVQLFFLMFIFNDRQKLIFIYLAQVFQKGSKGC